LGTNVFVIISLIVAQQDAPTKDPNIVLKFQVDALLDFEGWMNSEERPNGVI
jgi:hypothetical protein